MTDLDAEYYRANSEFQYQSAKELLSGITFRGDESIVDMGCGDGRITAELSRVVPQGSIVGVDSSPAMIKLAKSSFPKSDYPNLSFQLSNMEEAFLPSQVDMILSLNAFHWVRNPKKALAHFVALLKKGGRLFILTFPKGTLFSSFLEATVELPEWHSYKGLTASKHSLTEEGYRRLFRKKEFHLEKFLLREELGVYPTKEALKDYVRGWISSYIPLHKSFQEAFLEDAATQAKLHSITENEITLSYFKLFIQCQKI